jgi:hypothetical protein
MIITTQAEFDQTVKDCLVNVTEGQQCQNPELATSLFQINDVVIPKQNFAVGQQILGVSDVIKCGF